ncbi:MAG: metal-dependent transcriptional regulator [Candidatus Bathyarchaeota archaeon]|nr:metal-dependent transcriptional regulator [Candidatus Bathyarchaeota archaeon]
MPRRSIEDYLKTIYDLSQTEQPVCTTDISRTLKIAPASVTEMLKKLAEKGYITHSPYHGTRLTNNGKRTAKNIIRKHRLLESFLHGVLKVEKSQVHDQACGMEHSLSDDAAESLCRFLRHPARCPDNGKIIPPCDLQIGSCAECLELQGKGSEKNAKKGQNRVSIEKLEQGQCGKISLIRGGYNLLHRLLEMGLKPGIKICVVSVSQPSGPVEVSVGSSKLVLGKGIVSKVFVDLIEIS